MTRRMTCSVAVAAHNVERFIPEAIQSLLDQTCPPDQIVVVDDGSTDGTAAAVSRFGPKLQLIRQDRLGLPAARNRAVEACGGALVAFLDGEDVAEPQRLARQIEALQADRQAAMVFSAVRFIDETSQDVSKTAHCYQYDRKGFFGMLLVRNRIVSSSAAMLRRKALDEVGGFDQSLPHNAEYDLWLRIARRHPVAYLDEPLTRRRIRFGKEEAGLMAQRREEVLALQKHSHEAIREALEAAYDTRQDVEMAFARVLFRMERFDEAAHTLNSLQDEECQNPALHFYLGNILIVQGEIERAEEQFRQAVMLDPTFAAAHNNLGVMVAAAQKQEEARQSFEIACGLRLNYSHPAINLQILREGGSHRDMRITFDRMRETLRPEFGAAPVDFEA